jgi:FMN phosphatase YigB (HAD superfamily)
MADAFKVVLFDWRGTLFHDENDVDWIRASAASLGRALSDTDAKVLTEALENAAAHPDVLAARQQADCSLELHRAAALLEMQLAGFDDELALAIWSRDGDFAASIPYPDAPGVLGALKSRGIRIGIVSDIHYDLRPAFEHYGLADTIETLTLSCQPGCQKPNPRLFEIALQELGVQPAEALMVGDRPGRDGGAAAAGIITLILPGVPNCTPRGLDVVLRLIDRP